MKISGILQSKANETSGTNSRGPWIRIDYILEVPAEYPKKVCISVYNAAVANAFDALIGEAVRVSADIESREYQGRWYTSVRGYNIKPVVENEASTMPPAPQAEISQPAPETDDENGDDLPF